MPRKRNDTIVEKVRIERIAAEGKCLSRVDGKVILL